MPVRRPPQRSATAQARPGRLREVSQRSTGSHSNAADHFGRARYEPWRAEIMRAIGPRAERGMPMYIRPVWVM